MSIFTVSNSWYKSEGTADFSKKHPVLGTDEYIVEFTKDEIISDVRSCYSSILELIINFSFYSSELIGSKFCSEFDGKTYEYEIINKSKDVLVNSLGEEKISYEIVIKLIRCL